MSATDRMEIRYVAIILAILAISGKDGQVLNVVFHTTC